LDVVNFIAHGIRKTDPPEAAKSAENPSSAEGEEGGGGERNEKASPLEQYTNNLNQAAKEGKIDPLIGREYEVERTIQILCRRPLRLLGLKDFQQTWPLQVDRFFECRGR
jgi:ATP-dependent Clp protease ATP-binding subunit ClpA